MGQRIYRLIYFAVFLLLFLLVLYLAYIAHNVMPTKKISTKCSVFLQLVILRPHPHFTRHFRKKSAKPSAFYTFENPQIRILPEAFMTRRFCRIVNTTSPAVSLCYVYLSAKERQTTCVSLWFSRSDKHCLTYPFPGEGAWDCVHCSPIQVHRRP